MDTHERVAQSEQREGEALVKRLEAEASMLSLGTPVSSATVDLLLDAAVALAASQEKERQLVYVLETIRANARGSERVASSWLIARVDGAFDFTQTHGTSRVALDSTQTHGGGE